MIWVERIGFLLYTGLLARCDRQTGRIPLPLILAGCGGGLMLRAAELMSGTLSWRVLLSAYAAGAVWGVLLLLAGALARQAVGKGDGLCFISFAFWKDNAFVFTLLLLSVLLLALFGVLLMVFRKKKRDLSLPLMPFVWITAFGLLTAEVLPEVLR